MLVEGVSKLHKEPLEGELNSAHAKRPEQSEAEPFTLGEIVDVLNPLQHIPLANTLYRHVTGDEASTRSRVMGSMLYGAVAAGPLGAIGLSAANLGELAASGQLAEDARLANDARGAQASTVPETSGAAQVQAKLEMAAVRPEPQLHSIPSPVAMSVLQEDLAPLGDSSEPKQDAALSVAQTSVDGILADPRNLLSADLLKTLQSKHLENLTNDSA